LKKKSIETASLQKTLNVQIGLVVLGVGITIGILFLIFSFRVEDNKFQNSIALQQKHLIDTFTQQLWLLDLDTTQQLCNLAIESPEIKGLRLYDTNKKIIVENGFFHKDSAVHIAKELRYDDKTLVGYIEISFINPTLKQNQLFIILVGCSMMITTIIASFVLISSLLKRHLVIPLDNLQKDMIALTSGDFKMSKLNDQKTEIQNIINCFNQMASTLSSREKSKQLVELALRESEEKYRSIMESMDDAAYICSPEYRIEYFNPAMEKMVGYNAVGKKCYEVIYGFNKKCPECFFDMVKQGEIVKKEIFNAKKNKTYHISNSPLKHSDASISMLTVFRDITDIKHMEGVVQQAQKMEAIGTLAGGIAHDFNNILFPILGHSEMLLEDIHEEDHSRESVKSIHISALRAKELVQQILTFSRQEKSEMRLMKIQPILKEALKMLRATVPVTIDIDQNIDPVCNAVKADPTQIHQIIMNLTTNAYHAMDEEGGTMEVALKQIKLEKLDLINPDMEAGPFACLTVKDNGVGMENELIEKIFDPFFTTKENDKGTGLGLSVVHGIVNKMKGGIQVTSKPGKGTEIHVYFPIEENCLVDNSEINTEKIIIGGTERILLVDDDKGIIEMGKLVLERLGYHVTSSVNSLEALELYGENPDSFDLVITDFAMPNMAGDKFASEILKIRRDIPIILNTGYCEKITQEKAKRVGIKAILMKPMVKSELAKTIRKVLENPVP